MPAMRLRSATKRQRGPGMLSQLCRLVALAGSDDINARGYSLIRHCIIARYLDCVAAGLSAEANVAIRRIRLSREAVLAWTLERRERAT